MQHQEMIQPAFLGVIGKTSLFSFVIVMGIFAFI
ncbi:hypothetical protein VIAE109791_02790 [Vibrio aestuarianus subsp. francensis]